MQGYQNVLRALIFVGTGLCTNINAADAANNDAVASPGENGSAKSGSILNTLSKWVSLRQGFADQSLITNPAQLQLIIPSGSKNTYSIDAGLTYIGFRGNEFIDIAPSVEYHRQTDTDVEQNTVLAGLTVFNVWGDVADVIAAVSQFSARYKDDKIGTGSGAQIKLNMLPLVPNVGVGSGREFALTRYFWQPTLGVQYETGDDILDTGLSGHTGRGLVSVDLVIVPFWERLDSRINISGSLSYWKPFADSKTYRMAFGKDQSLVRVVGSYFLDKDKHLSIGIEYENGSQPEQGRLDQESIILAFQIVL